MPKGRCSKTDFDDDVRIAKDSPKKSERQEEEDQQQRVGKRREANSDVSVKVLLSLLLEAAKGRPTIGL